MHIVYNIIKQNNGSVKERQLSHTCAGDQTTYTTDDSAPSGILYPFCHLIARVLSHGWAPVFVIRF